MADITVTIPQAQVSRVATALGVSTVEEAKEWILTKVKEQVIAYETEQANLTEQAKIETAREAQEIAIQTARTTADSEITLS